MKRLSRSLNTEQREWLLLISACLLKLVAGQSISGGVFANFMKVGYRLTQQQLDFCIVLVFLGSLLIVVSGFVYDRWGARTSVIVSGVFSTVSTVCLAISMAHPEPLRQHLWLLYILLFLYGHSFNYSYVAAIACCMSSFKASRRGYIMALLDNSFNIGPCIVALLYYVVFDNTHRSLEAQSPVGTLVVMALFSAAVHLFALLFLTPLNGAAGDGLELDEATPILLASAAAESAKDESEDEVDEQPTSPPPPVPTPAKESGLAAATRDLLASCCCSGRFLPLLLGFGLAFASNLVGFLNLTSVTRSLDLTQYDVYYMWFPNLAGIALRFLIGPLTDRYFPLANQRSAVLLACVACLGTPAALMLSAPIVPGASPLGVTMTSSILACMSAASMFTLLPVIVSQTEPRHLFGRLYSACIVTGALMSLPLMLQFGAFYDSHSVAVPPPTTPAGSHGNGTGGPVEYQCTGQSCYVYGNVANTVCHLVSLAFLSYYTIELTLTGT